jgi:hypothetical protein
VASPVSQPMRCSVVQVMPQFSQSGQFCDFDIVFSSRNTNGVPSGAKFLVADVFVTIGASDHCVINSVGPCFYHIASFIITVSVFISSDLFKLNKYYLTVNYIIILF